MGALTAARQELNRKIFEKLDMIRSQVEAIAAEHKMDVKEVCRIATSNQGVMFVSPNNETWSGKGRKPTWLKQAEEEGIDPTIFRVTK